jgi:hypothetical protein
VFSVVKTTTISKKDIIISGTSKIGDVDTSNNQLLLLLVLALADTTKLYKIERIIQVKNM